MRLPVLIAVGLEKAIESVLRHDPETRARLEAINGKMILVNVTAPLLSIGLSIVDSQVYLSSHHGSASEGLDGDASSSNGLVGNDLQPDTIITGSLPALRSLLANNDAVYTGEVTIEGDIGTSAQLKQIFAQLDPDWQEAMSGYLGDGLTHKLDVAQAQFRQWFQRTRDVARSNTGDYLQEELEVLAPATCVHELNDEIDELRAAADRLEARIGKLENRQHAKNNK